MSHRPFGVRLYGGLVLSYLDALDRKGLFRLLNMGLDTFSRISSQYSEEEMQELGDGLVRLAGILKKLTAPETLDLLDRAADIPSLVDIDGATPPGPAELMKAIGDPEIKQSLGILLALTKGLAHLKR